MKFISICSGIEAASVAFNTLGWEAVAFSEIEPFPCALLAHHYPDIPNFGDMTKYKEWPEEVFAQADMIVGGPPCQSFSVAGKRQGLNDDRGNLTLIYTELIEHADTIRLKHGKPPVTIVYENVPGLLSDKTGAFGCFLGALAGEDCELQSPGERWTNAGYVLGPERAVAWRILDAKYFGLAQRRKRVFVVASARDGFCPAQVLFEFDGVRRDSAPSRESGQEATGNVGASFTSTSFGGYSEGIGTLRASGGDLGGGSETLVAYGIPGNWIGHKPENGGNSAQFMHEISPVQTDTDKHGVVCIGGQHPNAAIGEEVSPTLTEAMGTGGGHIPIINNVIAGTQNDAFRDATNNLAPTLRSGSGGGVVNQAVATPTAVRRLTPIECERLQGFPDFYTMIPWRGKPACECPDGHRYKALGNSMAVPVMRWIGERINASL